jgi:hypothetical protein
VERCALSVEMSQSKVVVVQHAGDLVPNKNKLAHT